MAENNIPKRPSNRHVYEKAYLWGWSIKRRSGENAVMRHPFIDSTIDIKHSSSRSGNSASQLHELYRLTCAGDAELFWSRTQEVDFPNLVVGTIAKTEIEKFDDFEIKVGHIHWLDAKINVPVCGEPYMENTTLYQQHTTKPHEVTCEECFAWMTDHPLEVWPAPEFPTEPSVPTPVTIVGEPVIPMGDVELYPHQKAGVEMVMNEPVKPKRIIRNRGTSNKVLEIMIRTPKVYTVRQMDNLVGAPTANTLSYLRSLGCVERIKNSTYQLADRLRTDDVRVAHYMIERLDRVTSGQLDATHLPLYQESAMPSPTAAISNKPDESPLKEILGTDHASSQSTTDVPPNTTGSQSGIIWTYHVEAVNEEIDAVLDLLCPNGFKAADLPYILQWRDQTQELLKQIRR